MPESRRNKIGRFVRIETQKLSQRPKGALKCGAMAPLSKYIYLFMGMQSGGMPPHSKAPSALLPINTFVYFTTYRVSESWSRTKMRFPAKIG